MVFIDVILGKANQTMDTYQTQTTHNRTVKRTQVTRIYRSILSMLRALVFVKKELKLVKGRPLADISKTNEHNYTGNQCWLPRQNTESRVNHAG
jgi:hypothetical protein